MQAQAALPADLRQKCKLLPVPPPSLFAHSINPSVDVAKVHHVCDGIFVQLVLRRETPNVELLLLEGSVVVVVAMIQRSDALGTWAQICANRTGRPPRWIALYVGKGQVPALLQMHVADRVGLEAKGAVQDQRWLFQMADVAAGVKQSDAVRHGNSLRPFLRPFGSGQRREHGVDVPGAAADFPRGYRAPARSDRRRVLFAGGWRWHPVRGRTTCQPPLETQFT